MVRQRYAKIIGLQRMVKSFAGFEQAETPCKNIGQRLKNQFVDVNKMLEIG